MEDYTAEGRKPLHKCLDDVRQCDVYVGIFAWRYGHVPPEHTKSITELEYREAKKYRIPTRIFLLHENAEWPQALRAAGEDARRITALREELKLAELVAFFPPLPESLTNAVQAALHKIVNTRHSRSRKYMSATIILIVLVFAYLFWSTNIRQSMASIQGEVITASHEPITNAVVELDKLPGKTVHTLSGGDFSFDEVPGKIGDPVTIRVKAPGFKTEIRKGMLNRPETIVLERDDRK
jgi:hypothetical protein